MRVLFFKKKRKEKEDGDANVRVEIYKGDNQFKRLLSLAGVGGANIKMSGPALT